MSLARDHHVSPCTDQYDRSPGIASLIAPSLAAGHSFARGQDPWNGPKAVALHGGCLLGAFFLEVGGCTVKMAKSSLPSAEFALRLKTPGASEGWFFPKPPPEPGPDWDRSHRSGAASRPSSCQVGRLERAQSDAAPPTGAAHRGAADRADRADRSAGGEGE